MLTAIIIASLLLGVVPIQQPHPQDCAIAVTEMVLQYYSQDVSGLHDEMRGDIPESDGINSAVIVDILRARGLSAEWKILYPFEFIQFVRAEIQAGRPVIAIMKSGAGYHVVLIVGIDERIWYINPTRGEVVSREIKDFTQQALTDWGIYAIQILPALPLTNNVIVTYNPMYEEITTHTRTAQERTAQAR